MGATSSNVGNEARDGGADADDVVQTARGIATAVAPEGGLADVQAALLQAITSALTGIEVDYRNLEPMGPEDLAIVLAERDENYRQRIVHHMVLAELVLRPLPTDVALRVARYAAALGIDDRFVRVARRYAQGAYGLAWMDLRRSGFVEHVQDANKGQTPGAAEALVPKDLDPETEDLWESYAEFPEESLGRAVWTMYDGRGFPLPGSPDGASQYLAQHDYMHVLADYGTNLTGELEVFACIGRADPDPKGFAWLATLIGLFETGYISDTGFFERDVRQRHIQAPGMHHRIADAIRRGKAIEQRCRKDLFVYDFAAEAHRPVAEVRAKLDLPDKSELALASGSAGVFDRAGMSEFQQRVAAEREGEHA